MKNFLTTELDQLIDMLNGISKEGLTLKQRILIERCIEKMRSVKRVIYYLLP